MIIYKDVVTGDELFSDVFTLKELHGVAFEVEGKYIISKSESYDIGANPSAEETPESYDNAVSSGIDIVLAHRLVEIQLSKPMFKDCMKDYVKKVLEMVTQEHSDSFKKNTSVVVKELLRRFDDLRFFVGESNEVTGAIMVLDYREDGTTPYFTVLKDGLEAMKC